MTEQYGSDRTKRLFGWILAFIDTSSGEAKPTGGPLHSSLGAGRQPIAGDQTPRPDLSPAALSSPTELDLTGLGDQDRKDLAWLNNDDRTGSHLVDVIEFEKRQNDRET